MRLRQRSEEEQKKQRTLKDQLARARARFQELSEVTLKVDSRVRAWKLMASDGEYVSRGQPLVTLLRCDDLFVVAAVRERIFNKLEIGSPARFKADDGSVYQGSVVQLDGLTRMHEEETVVAPGMVGQRDPIPTSADPYRVTIALPGLAARQAPTCGVGRSGEVVFD